jgi:penicillin-binding protein 1A
MNGIENSYQFLTEKLHFTSLVAPTETHAGDANMASLSMGAFAYGVTMREMIGGYGVIASGGTYREPISYSKIETGDGTVIVEKDTAGEQACSTTAAWLMHDLLVDSATYGLAAPGRLSVPLAAKTGTSDDNHDKWFMGYTPHFVGGVWVGYDEPTNLVDAGVIESVPKVIWKNVMQHVVDAVGWEGGEFMPRPEDLVRVSICGICGRRPGSNSVYDNGRSSVFYAWFTEDTIPKTWCACKPLSARTSQTAKNTVNAQGNGAVAEN